MITYSISFVEKEEKYQWYLVEEKHFVSRALIIFFMLPESMFWDIVRITLVGEF